MQIVGIGTDGASVNSGEWNGLIALLRRRYTPKLQATHCVPHRVSLAASVLQEVQLIETIHSLMQLSFFNASISIIRMASLCMMFVSPPWLHQAKGTFGVQ